jgi:hypothetical protein
MSLQTQVNSIDCSAGNNFGTGLAGCRIDRKRVVALGLLQKGFKFSETIDKASLRALQIADKLIMLQGVVSFADNTAEDNIVTRAGSGIKVVAGKNPYEYAVEFDNGINFHRALTSLRSYEGYDLIMFDEDGVMFLTETKGGQVKGYNLGMFENGKYMGSNGAEASSQIVTLQIIDRDELDLRPRFITAENLDFSPSELTGTNQVLFTVNPVVAASTSIVVSAFLQDKTNSVEGLAVADFKVLRNDAVVTPSAVSYNADTKKYTLTVSANSAGDVIKASINGIILTAADELFKSNVATAVVT